MDQEFQQSTRNGLYQLCDVWVWAGGCQSLGLPGCVDRHTSGLDELRRWPLQGRILPCCPRDARGNLCSGQKPYGLLCRPQPWGPHRATPPFSIGGPNHRPTWMLRKGHGLPPLVGVGSKNLYLCFKTTNLSRQKLFKSLSQAKYTHFLPQLPPIASSHYGFGHTLRVEGLVPSSSLV